MLQTDLRFRAMAFCSFSPHWPVGVALGRRTSATSKRSASGTITRQSAPAETRAIRTAKRAGARWRTARRRALSLGAERSSAMRPHRASARRPERACGRHARFCDRTDIFLAARPEHTRPAEPTEDLRRRGSPTAAFGSPAAPRHSHGEPFGASRAEPLAQALREPRETQLAIARRPPADRAPTRVRLG